MNDSDKIDPRKVKANLFVLENESFEIAEAYSKRDREKEELLKFSTQSIKKINRLEIPEAFPLGFVAVYPDVVVWWNYLGNKQDNILESFAENETDLLDKKEMVKSKYLKLIIEAYKNTGASLECSRGDINMAKSSCDKDEKATTSTGLDYSFKQQAIANEESLDEEDQVKKDYDDEQAAQAFEEELEEELL